MPKMICMPCNQEFSSEASYLKHKESGHTTKGQALEGPGDVSAPTPEFLEAVARIESQKDEQPPTPERPQLPDPKPIALTYVYTGDCPSCRRQPSTLELQVKDTFFVIAYCDNCKKQLMEKEVVKL